MKRDEHHDRRRFWRRVKQAPDGCWVWAGGTRESGYGSFAVKHAGRWTQTTSHRWSYVDMVGPIPEGFEVDHLCRNRSCVRPDHLEAVTLAENRRRRDHGHPVTLNRDLRPLPVIPNPVSRPQRDPSRCTNGHEYALVGWVTNGARRTCRACRDDRSAKRRRGGAHGTETHCPQGHPYSGDNLVMRRGTRECRACVRARNSAAYARRKALAT